MRILTESDYSLKSSFKITSAETDMQSRLRLGAMVNLLIQNAIDHADHIEMGFAGLKKQELFWVLSRLSMKIERPVNWYEQVEVETWPKRIDRLMYIRDFLIRDSNKKVIAGATSGWLAIDLVTKRPKHLEGVHKDMFLKNQDKHGLEPAPVKLAPVKEGEQFEFKSSYFDIDLNKHVTATRYIDWMMDTLPLDFHLKNFPKSLSVNYLKETMPSENIKIEKIEDEKKRFSFEGTNMSSESIAFRGLIEF